MYFDPQAENCRYSLVSNLQTSEFKKPADRAAAFAGLYNIPTSELNGSLKKIQLVACANLYFKYLFDRSLLDAKTQDIPVFLSSVERYNLWPFAGDKPAFEDVRDLVITILPSL
jgi:hypothetical protein